MIEEIMTKENLIKQLTTLLIPFISQFMRSDEVLNVSGNRIGELAFNEAILIWEKLRSQLEKDPEATRTFEEVAVRANDPRAEAILSWQLERLLAAMPPETVSEIGKIIAEARIKDRIATSSERSIAIGGSVSGNIIITGEKIKKY